MTMQRSRVRTPRRRKVWIVKNFGVTDFVQANRWIVGDILSAGLVQMGLAAPMGMTCMRIVGQLWLGAAASATTPAFSTVRLGFAWVPNDVAGAGVGDAQIPEPLEEGVRETQWIQQGYIAGFEVGGTPLVGTPLDPQETSIWKFDITAMRKQPTGNARLVLIADGGASFETDTVEIRGYTNTMVALP